MSEPRVLVATPDFPPAVGGIQELTFQITTHLRRMSATVVTPASRGTWRDRGTEAQHVIRVGHVWLGRGASVALTLAAFPFIAMWKRPELVLCAHPLLAPSAALAARMLRVPLVGVVYGKEIPHRSRGMRALGRGADQVVAISTYTAELAAAAGVPRAKTTVIPVGVTLPPAAGPLAGGSRVVVVARLVDAYKGHDVLLKALVPVLAAVPDAHLDIVGDGPLAPGLRSLAVSLGVSHHVTFHGQLSDAGRDAVLDAASVFAMPSRLDEHGGGEGFGIVYLEAGARGLPVVAGNVGGATDAVVHGETGLLVDPTDPDAVAGAIVALLTDKDRARSMGEAGRRWAERHAWPTITARWEDLLLEVIDAHRRS